MIEPPGPWGANLCSAGPIFRGAYVPHFFEKCAEQRTLGTKNLLVTYWGLCSAGNGIYNMLLNFLISTVVTFAKLNFNFNWSWGKPYFCQTQLQLQLIRWRFSGKTLTRLGQVVVYIVYTICRFEILDVQVLHQQLFPTSAIYVYCSLKIVTNGAYKV